MNYTICEVDYQLRQGYFILQYVILTISIPINIIGLFLIYSDKSTRVKWLIFNNQLWFFIFNVFISGPATPVWGFPVPSYTSVGLLNKFSIPPLIQLEISVACISCIAGSTIHLFFYRHQTLLPDSHPRTFGQNATAAFLGIFYLYCFSIVGAVYYVLCGERETCIDEYSKEFSCLPTEIFLSGTVLISLDNLTFLLIYAYIFCVTWITLVILLVIDSFKAIKYGDDKMSQQTKDQLRKSLRKIVFQIMVYFLCIVIPSVAVGAVIVGKVNSEAVIDFSMSLISCNSTVGSLYVICSNQKYRNYLIGLLWKKRDQGGTRLVTRASTFSR